MTLGARALDHEKLTALRRRGVAAVQSGESPAQVAAVLGVDVASVYRWLAAYRRGGWDEVDARKRGGRPPKLNGTALRWIYDTILNKTPQQIRLPSALWTAATVQVLIRERFGVRLSHSSVYRLLNQLGLGPRDSPWRADQQDSPAVRRWRQTEYEAIRRRAKRLDAQVFFAGAAGVRPEFDAGTAGGQRGKVPAVSRAGARPVVHLVSAVSARGQLRFMLAKGRMTAAAFIEFLKRLMDGTGSAIFVIVDGHPAYQAKSVTRFVAGRRAKLDLFFLPVARRK